VFFGDDVSWCVYAGHEEWDRSEIWESAARTSFA
jgi:hypothetical protein